MQTSFLAKSYTSRTCVTFGGKRGLQTPNLLDLAVLRQLLRVATASNGVFRKGKIQQTFFSKYSGKMVFVLSPIRSAASTTLCEPKDRVTVATFPKIVLTRDFGTIHIGLYIT